MSNDHSRATDLDAVRQKLRDRTELLCRRLLPHGHRSEDEWHAGWLIPRMTNHALDSWSCPIWDRKEIKVRVQLSGPEMGTWADTESGRHGDAFDLVKTICGPNTAYALEWSEAWLEGKPPPPHPAILELARLLARQIAEEEFAKSRSPKA